jgi:DNA modification methylase
LDKPSHTELTAQATSPDIDATHTHTSGGASLTASPPVGTPPSYSKNDLFRDANLAWIAVNLIDAAPRRVRRALSRQIDGVVRSIKRFGYRIPILVRTEAGGERYQVVDGHIRLEAARRLGADQIPCLKVDDLTDNELRQLRLSLNKLQETGAWDIKALQIEVGEIIEITGELEIPGFELPEVEALFFDQGGADPADDVSGPGGMDAPSVGQLGDVWILGDHRVLCGSARDEAAVAALLNGDAASALWTDPPYNVPIKGHVRSSDGFDEFAEASGEMSRAEFQDFLQSTLGPAVACVKPGGVVFVCMDWRHVGELTETFEALDLMLLNLCVWVKTNPGMGSLYRSQHELVFVGSVPGGPHQNNVQLGQYGRNRSNVWPYAGATGGCHDPDDDFGAHPTVKPIRMVMDALLDVTQPGDLVLDPFLGSGTTLLAAERTRRRCVGVEIEPRYVDLAIRRWQEMTGGQAINAETGECFDDRAARVVGEHAPIPTQSREDF